MAGFSRRAWAREPNDLQRRPTACFYQCRSGYYADGQQLLSLLGSRVDRPTTNGVCVHHGAFRSPGLEHEQPRSLSSLPLGIEKGFRSGRRGQSMRPLCPRGKEQNAHAGCVCAICAAGKFRLPGQHGMAASAKQTASEPSQESDAGHRGCRPNVPVQSRVLPRSRREWLDGRRLTAAVLCGGCWPLCQPVWANNADDVRSGHVHRADCLHVLHVSRRGALRRAGVV